jgi:hypothetical protein
VHFIAFRDQESCQIGSVLTSYTRDHRDLVFAHDDSLKTEEKAKNAVWHAQSALRYCPLNGVNMGEGVDPGFRLNRHFFLISRC